MRKEKRKSATACLAAAVFLSCLFAQSGDASRLTKTAKRDGRKVLDEDATGALQEGKIVFGADLETGSDLKAQEGKTLNASKGDENAYQADFPGWPKGQAQDGFSNEATWRRMSPSLLCGWDQMRFKAIGPGASQLALAQGNALPLPLSNIPPSCGYSMQRNSLAMVLVIPYDGCNVLQEGGSYTLPLRWNGIPVLLLCSRPAISVTTPPPQIVGYPPTKHQMPQVPWMNHIPQQPNPQYPYVPLPDQTNIQKPEKPKLPQYNTFYPPFYPFLPTPPPVAMAAPTKKATSAAMLPVFNPAQRFPFNVFPPVQPGQWPFPPSLPGAGNQQGVKPQMPPGQMPPGQMPPGQMPPGQFPFPLPLPGAVQPSPGTQQGAKPQLPPGQWPFLMPFPGAKPPVQGPSGPMPPVQGPSGLLPPVQGPSGLLPPVQGPSGPMPPGQWRFPLPLPGAGQSSPGTRPGPKPQSPSGSWTAPGAAQPPFGAQPGAKPQLPPGQWPFPLPLPGTGQSQPGAKPQLPPGQWPFPLPLPGTGQSQPGAKPQIPPGQWPFPLPLPGTGQPQQGAKPQLPPGQWPFPLPLPGTGQPQQGAKPQIPPGQWPFPLPLPGTGQSSLTTQPGAKPQLQYYQPYMPFPPMLPPGLPSPQDIRLQSTPTHPGDASLTGAQPFFHPHHLIHNHPHSHLLQPPEVGPPRPRSLSYHQHDQPQSHSHYHHAHSHPQQMQDYPHSYTEDEQM